MTTIRDLAAAWLRTIQPSRPPSVEVVNRVKALAGISHGLHAAQHAPAGPCEARALRLVQPDGCGVLRSGLPDAERVR